MDIEEVRQRVKTIRDIGNGDPEASHGREDDLREAFIRWIAGSAQVPVEVKEIAIEIIQTSTIDFPRWCA